MPGRDKYSSLFGSLRNDGFKKFGNVASEQKVSLTPDI